MKPHGTVRWQIALRVVREMSLPDACAELLLSEADPPHDRYPHLFLRYSTLHHYFLFEILTLNDSEFCVDYVIRTSKSLLISTNKC
jgi:hypothetical protein